MWKRTAVDAGMDEWDGRRVKREKPKKKLLVRGFKGLTVDSCTGEDVKER